MNWTRFLRPHTRQPKVSARPAPWRPNLTVLDDRLVPSVTQVTDINVGGSSDPQNLTAVGSEVFFSADDGVHGRELWKSDGSTTTLVADLNSPGSSDPRDLTAVGGVLYFTANDGTNGRELWKSDGTAVGTVRVTDINLGAGDGLGSPSHPVAVGSTIFFLANSGDGTWDVWRTDGTAPGTLLLKDIAAGEAVASPTAFQGELFFGFATPLTPSGNRSELWKSDGTVVGTVLAASIGVSTDPTDGVSAPAGLAAGQTKLFFTADSQPRDAEPWVYDGLTGTAAEVDLSPDLPGDPHTSYPGRTNYSDGYAGIYTVIGDTAYFGCASDTTGDQMLELNGNTLTVTIVGEVGASPAAAAGTKLYYFNGTFTLKVFDTVARTTTTVATGTSPYDLTVVGNKVYFGQFTPFNGYELWVTDVNTQATQMVANINPGFFASSDPRFLTTVGNTLYFAATDGTSGRELWKVTP